MQDSWRTLVNPRSTLVKAKQDLHKSFYRILCFFDDVRIRQHLRKIEYHLRTQTPHHLSATQAENRYRLLDELHNYWKNGKYPRNQVVPGAEVPCFIDQTGRTCAVAALMIASQSEMLATQIAQSSNYLRIKEMRVPGMTDWANTMGMTTDELAAIQPGYPHEPDLLPLMQTLIISGITISIGTLITWSQKLLRRIAGGVIIAYSLWLLLFSIRERGTPTDTFASYGNPFGDFDLWISLITLIVGIFTIVSAFRKTQDHTRSDK
jgi:hypothetical protein